MKGYQALDPNIAVYKNTHLLNELHGFPLRLDIDSRYSNNYELLGPYV